MDEGLKDATRADEGHAPPEGAPPVDERHLAQEVRASTGREHYRTGLTIREHAFAADEPPEVGGKDSGPSPFELVCAALASCTTITVRMYADRKGWPLEAVDAWARHARLPVERDGVTSNVDRFTVSIGLTGELDDAQRARLTEIAGRCPVHRMLVAGSVVEVQERISNDNEGGGVRAS